MFRPSATVSIGNIALKFESLWWVFCPFLGPGPASLTDPMLSWGFFNDRALWKINADLRSSILLKSTINTEIVTYIATSIFIHYNAEKSTCRQMNKCPTIPTYPNITKYVLLREETSMYVWNKIYLTVQCSLPCILLEVLSQHILNYSDVANNKLDNFLYGASAAYWEAKLITKSL